MCACVRRTQVKEDKHLIILGGSRSPHFSIWNNTTPIDHCILCVRMDSVKYLVLSCRPDVKVANSKMYYSTCSTRMMYRNVSIKSMSRIHCFLKGIMISSSIGLAMAIIPQRAHIILVRPVIQTAQAKGGCECRTLLRCSFLSLK
jgi:hypothetical protein